MSAVDLDKIRKLLALARSTAGTAEGSTARAMAERRMTEAGVTEDEVLSDRKVALERKAAIWEQALMESCADLSGCGLQVDRATNVWTLSGSMKATGEAEDRFHGVRRALLRAVSSYLSEVRESMRAALDDPSFARSTLERMKRVFLESASITVLTRMLERIMAEPEGKEVVGKPLDPDEMPTEEPSRKKRPFERLVDRFELGAIVDWDMEIEVADDMDDPSSAGHRAGLGVPLDPPWEKPSDSRRLSDGSGGGRLAVGGRATREEP